jgi:hypothetical protein
MELAYMPWVHIRSPLAHLDAHHSLAYAQHLLRWPNMVPYALRVDLDLYLDCSRLLFSVVGCVDQYSTHAERGH